jgi:hypothetical protein
MARQFDWRKVMGLDALGHRGQGGQGKIGHTVCTSWSSELKGSEAVIVWEST